jgi:hypothetical protein
MLPLCQTATIDIDFLPNRYRLPAEFPPIISSLIDEIIGNRGGEAIGRARAEVSRLGSCSPSMNVSIAPFANGMSENGVGPVNLIIWWPALFVLGLASLGICLAFVSACDKI